MAGWRACDGDAALSRADASARGLPGGRYRWTGFDTRAGRPTESHAFVHGGGEFALACGAVACDLAVAITPEGRGMPHLA